MASSPDLVVQLYENVGISTAGAPDLNVQLYENVGIGPPVPDMNIQLYENVVAAILASPAATFTAFRR